MDTKQLLEAVETLRIIKSLFEHQNNDWLPVVAAVGGAFVGGLSTFFASYALENKHRKIERISVSNALIAEVQSIMTIIEQREYIFHLKQIIKRLETGNEKRVKASVRVPNHYSRIYQAHVGRLGILDSEFSTKVIKFHQLIDAVVQDITPGGVIVDPGGDVNAFKQFLAILNEAVKLGIELASYEHHFRKYQNAVGSRTCGERGA